MNDQCHESALSWERERERGTEGLMFCTHGLEWPESSVFECVVSILASLCAHFNWLKLYLAIRDCLNWTYSSSFLHRWNKHWWGWKEATTLLDTYATFGQLKRGEKVLEKLPDKGIMGCFGCRICSTWQLTKVVEKCLQTLQVQGLKPNDVIFTSLLAACSHVSFQYCPEKPKLA